jgi:phosphoribosylaminoimidazolecarboxamide formyltransferase / IMP cyclohydrolase
MTETLKERLTNKPVAFISVFDKSGLEPLAKALVEQYGYRLISTGGTRKFLDEKQIPSIESSEITGFEALLGGRVKSLHPEIFAGILAESQDRQSSKAIPFFIDTVIVNLYPFEAEREQQSRTQQQHTDHLLHFIDIGGSALIRAAAKNYPSVSVLSSPAQYSSFLKELSEQQGKASLDFRQQLALEAFSLTAYYDSLIAEELAGQSPRSNQTITPGLVLPETLTVPLRKINNLRYGENPHQGAALYGIATGKTDFECLHGKELSFNNILDMEAAWRITTEFSENMACAIIKHNNPCGVALSSQSVADAFQRALDTDSVSAFGGVVSFNEVVTEAAAKLMAPMFLEVIIAPGFEPGAFDLLSSKKNLRLVVRNAQSPTLKQIVEYKHVSEHLILVQGVDSEKLAEQEKCFSVVSAIKPTSKQLEDIVFAWKVVKHVKSNAIVLAKNGQTVGIGGGNTSRIGALENALKLACDASSGAVMASDGFLPHEDNIYAAVQARISAIIQPGGSVKDSLVIELANKHNIAMVTTGVREFKH